MKHDDPQNDLLREERRAFSMAEHARETLEGGDDATLSAELEHFCVYLATDFEEHLDREEAVVFPFLEARGLIEEVAEAKRQHRDLRRLRAHLACTCYQSRASARHVLGTMARLLAAHVRYEADLIYAGLTQVDAERLRASQGAEPWRRAAIARPPRAFSGGAAATS